MADNRQKFTDLAIFGQARGYARISIHISVCICIYICVCVCTYVCMHACMYVCIYIYSFVLYVRIERERDNQLGKQRLGGRKKSASGRRVFGFL